MKKITIINTVPINGGDEALLKATLLGLNKYFSNPTVHVLCNNPTLYRNHVNYVDLDWDWEYAFLQADPNENQTWFRLKRRCRVFLMSKLKLSYFSFLSRVLSSKREKRVYNKLKKSDLILLGAGGYIHDFYGYNKRLETLHFIAIKLNKPYYFFSQSIGPFWEEKNYEKLNYYFDKAEKIILREKHSLKHLKEIRFHCNNVYVTNDVAFYLYSKYAKTPNLKKQLKKIAVNFREWEFEDEGKEIYLKAVSLCEFLIKKNYQLVFVSTCQGVEGYKDDSVLAKKIVNALPQNDRDKCKILNEKFTVDDLIEQLSTLDAYIGMRLHVAILSLLSGIPALNIAYEDKSLGVFDALGLENYSYSYKETPDDWFKMTENFIANHSSYLESIDEKIKAASNLVERNFQVLLN